MTKDNEEYRRHCIVLTTESEDDIKKAQEELVKQGEDFFALNKSIIIRKALKHFVKCLTIKRR